VNGKINTAMLCNIYKLNCYSFLLTIIRP